MNIRINIKQCDCEPTVITKKEISQVEFKKKSMLYAPPTKDNKKTNTNLNKKTQEKHQQSTVTTKQQYQQKQSPYSVNQQDQRKFLKQMNDFSKNQLQSDMTQHTQTILQKQNQILQQNQKTIYHMLSNQPNQNTSAQIQQMRNLQLRKTFQEAADKIAREVKDIKKMRDQILQFGQSFKKTVQQGRGQQHNKTPQQIGQMNSNLRNLVQISKNHIQGLQNLQGIKNLQNFNIQAYTQAINTLKKQIVQYQKQSQTIERQLKLRSAKLQKLQVSPNFDQQLLQPYEQYLKKKAQNINLHSIKDKVYQKLGVFDYGKFQTDVSTLSNQIKSEMNDFYITCKQYRIQIPDIKIDKKQLKQLDLKLPSVLDEFKQKKDMVFTQRTADQEKVEGERKPSKTIMRQTSSKSFKNTSQNQKLPQTTTQNVFKRTSPQKMFEKGQIYTKPVDYSKSTKLSRVQDQQYKTVLQTTQQQQRRQVIKNIKRPPLQQQRSQDDDFQKYLQNRAKQELASIYEQKKKKLQQMEKQLYDKCKQQQPKYELTINLKNRVSPKKVLMKEQKGKMSQKQNQEEQYEQQFEQQFTEQIQKEKRNLKKQQQSPSINKQKQQIKNIGTEVLRQKLKNLFSKNPSLNQHVHQNRLINNNEPQQIQMNQMTSIAQGFVNMINNTLTQVNTQLSQSIQKKMQNRSFSRQKRPQFERKSPNQITIPKLQQFRAPPVFNMQMVYQPVPRQQEKRVEKKIVPKDYNYLRISQENNQLEISSISDDF